MAIPVVDFTSVQQGTVIKPLKLQMRAWRFRGSRGTRPNSYITNNVFIIGISRN
ncbi:hypothetical protein ENH_00031710 [Eimeria necatrix]|uniref:Uncharacterized protein n=1 Tax=Eimeria necatrix TaxID=51315 RepID=U6MZI9_9EIME|nr:hypothetical protein ENH_00031710 [Eimeria necatrix]CDJ67085.1 hypothetical protein ENH_00031710 [Eimeria necatrix]